MNTPQLSRIPPARLQRSIGARATVSFGGKRALASRASPIYAVRILTIPVFQVAIPVDYEGRNATRNSLPAEHATALALPANTENRVGGLVRRREHYSLTR